MKYQIAIKYLDGDIAYLVHRNKTAWAVKTARKYLRECVREKIANNPKWVEVWFFALVAA